MYEATFAGNVSIGGGKFRRRPDESHLQPNCGIVPVLLADGTFGYAVRFHQHDYKFVNVGPLLIGVCVSRDQGQGLLEISACRAKVVAMCEVVPGKVFDGTPVDTSGVYYLNLSEALDLFPDIDWETLVDDIQAQDRTALVQDILGMIFGTDSDVLEDKAFLSKDQFEELTGATVNDPYFTTNASLIDDIIGDGDQLLDDAPVDVGRYKFCIDVDTPSGNRITVCNAFSITPALMAGVKIVLQPEKTSFVYSGSDVGYTGLVATYSPDDALEPLVLEEGRDYSVSGTLQATALGEHSFTVKGTGNYFGSRTFVWQIVEPSGDFPGGVLRPAPSALGEYGAVIGDKVVVRRSEELIYDKATGTWRAGLELAWPSDAGYRISPESICVTPSTQSRMYRGSDILAGDVDGEYLKITTDADGFLSTLTWEVVLSADKIRIDVLSGIPQYDYELTAFAGASEECPGGLKKTKFGLVIPLGNLALYNDTGSRKYPAHVHEWSFEEPVEGRLEAKCVSRSAGKRCREGVALTLGDEDSSEYAYTGLPIALSVGNLGNFYLMTGALVGDVTYRQDGVALEGAPIKAGDYEAVIEILPMNADPYTFTRTFTILPPEGGSYETMSVQLLTRKQEDLVASYDDETVRTRLRSLCGSNNEFVLQVSSWLKAHGITQMQLKESRFLQAARALNTKLLDRCKILLGNLEKSNDSLAFSIAVKDENGVETPVETRVAVLADYIKVSSDGGRTFVSVKPEDLEYDSQTKRVKYIRRARENTMLLKIVVPED